MSASDSLWLVFGASGYVGRNMVPHLVAQGRRVRAAARRLSAMEAEGWQGVDQMRADALDPATLGPALAGVEVAFYLVHSMGGGRGFPARR
ncbi:NAD(P)H-binding protein [Halomonas sp. HK25]|uniref:NmrA family NAD(P)-binding protein n=1 Tax=Halomonas sp. HK25 TaxID=3394321 RepID=UPI0039FD74E5